MFAYTLSLTTIALHRGNANDVSVFVACCAIFGALFDVVESFGLMLMANDPLGMNPVLPFGVTLLAIIKFVLLIIAVVYCVRPFELPGTKLVDKKA